VVARAALAIGSLRQGTLPVRQSVTDLSVARTCLYVTVAATRIESLVQGSVFTKSVDILVTINVWIMCVLRSHPS
jgi:hypothetical protein